jgi:hypothetical protein
MITITEERQEEAAAFQVLEVDGDEILAAFTEVMLEWGHYRTAAGLTFPALDEAARVAAGRRDDRGWTRSPLP